ncbi:acyl-CoA dehydrogenase family protein [Arthrobacter sp. STN4]|uniref:acyl-CoA dehydrogenase family protein n=1 Tax=Arthrobacter sp. STN4 TaxID=2923276 RepID=UPI00211A5FE2|nr:acyl-CoA dehydrogenase family protein [Arthrobacter sp. STN4]MCQ9165325.1 acyl-CoA dehydrogenase family protein [Arthrobacter sp. STN4]
MPDYDVSEPLDTDYFDAFAQLSPEDRKVWDRARSLAAEALPQINDYWDRADYPLHLVRRMGELNLLADGLEVPGLETMSPMAAGLVNMEISRIDGSLGTVVAVQGGLAMRSIAYFGSDAQKERWLGPLARGEEYGAFALTEPDHGSDSVGLTTSARRDGDEWVLDGEKKWIGNGSVGGVTVVWARVADAGADDDGGVRGFLVEQDTPGYEAETITGKGSLRAIFQARISLNGVRIPASNVLPGSHTFKDTSKVLVATRLGVAWSALGHATAVYEAALSYANQRIQFGKPLARFQLVQERLTQMLAELTGMQLMCVQAATLDAAGTLLPTQASMAKYNNTRKARQLAAMARDMLGGNGILLENHVVRHLMDIESIHTYEGTESVQTLLIGRDITGQSAFA